MTANSKDKNRLLLEIDNSIKQINDEIINPQIPELTLEAIKPVMATVARARAAYLKELFNMVAVIGEEQPEPERIARLKTLRETYEELLAAAKALENAISRGYLDVVR